MTKPTDSLDDGRTTFRLRILQPGIVTDPVCSAEFALEDAAATGKHKGQTLHFCSEACRNRFLEDPDSYS